MPRPLVRPKTTTTSTVPVSKSPQWGRRGGSQGQEELEHPPPVGGLNSSYSQPPHSCGKWTLETIDCALAKPLQLEALTSSTKQVLSNQNVWHKGSHLKKKSASVWIFS